MGDIFIRYIDMEYTVPAVTQVDANGDYNVYVNARLGYDQQQIAIQHELRHIQQDHFHRDTPVALDEQQAENSVKVKPVESKPAPRPDFAKLRAKTGYTAYQVSKFVGISTSRYVRIEHGLTQPMPDELLQITSFFKRKAGV